LLYCRSHNWWTTLINYSARTTYNLRACVCVCVIRGDDAKVNGGMGSHDAAVPLWRFFTPLVLTIRGIDAAVGRHHHFTSSRTINFLCTMFITPGLSSPNTICTMHAATRSIAMHILCVRQDHIKLNF